MVSFLILFSYFVSKQIVLFSLKKKLEEEVPLAQDFIKNLRYVADPVLYLKVRIFIVFANKNFAQISRK